jgi:subtilase family serine protease
MRSNMSWAHALAARAGALALAVPMVLGGAAPASAAIVSHAVTPAVGTGSQYEPLTADEGLGIVHFGCQLAAPPACYGPDQIRAAYDIQSVLNSGVTGAGRTIVIVDAFQSPTIATDLAKFDLIWNLPAPPAFNVIAPDGLTPFDKTKGNQRSWSAEISLDVEWAHAVAPGAVIDLVLAKSDKDADILSATRYAVVHNLGDVISQSFGEAEMCADPKLIRQEHAIFGAAGRKGMTLFASSGDTGAAQPTCDNSALVLSASTPASDPQVTAVGGTALTTVGTNGLYQSESAWSASGGGFSTIYRRPGYQAPFQHNNKQRGVPDVAYDADTAASGVIVVWSAFAPAGTFQYWRFGGTSVGSPQWAGIVALADQQGGHRLGAINKALYHIGKSDAYGSAFHDITAGNNSFLGVTGFAAGPGWDATTGLGTPDVAHLIPLLVGEPADDSGQDDGGQDNSGSGGSGGSGGSDGSSGPN